jgi:uroporphyrinogen decarboxylase
MNFSANPAALQNIYAYYHASSHQQLLEQLNVDIFDMRGIADPVYRGPVAKEFIDSSGVKQNFWGMRTKIIQTATGAEECFCDFKLKGISDLGVLAQYPWPDPDWFDYSDLADRLARWDQYAIMAAHGSFFQMAANLMGLDDFLVSLILNTDAAEYVMDRCMNFFLGFYERMLCAAPGKISILRLAEDIGMQDRPMIGMNIFNDLILPRIKRFADLAHSYNVKLMFHFCGSIDVYIEKLIQAGVDILDPIQPRARNMDPKNLKASFGSKICFHGSVDTQYTLPKGSPEEVEQEVKERIETIGHDGGFILAPCHVLQTDVPMQNIRALYETGYRYGCY